MKDRLPPLTPLLVACLFVMVSYRELQAFVKWEELLGILAVALAAATLLHLAVRRFVSEAPRAALLTTLIILLVCFYGDADARVKKLFLWTGLDALARARYIAPILALAFGLAAWGILRAPWPVGRLKAFLRVFFAGMVGATVLLNQLYPSQFVSRQDRPREVDEHGPFARTNDRPDIYVILLDAYTSPENLRRLWNYDIAPFTSFLEAQGFFVLTNAGANYEETPRCIGSLLNMNHVREPPKSLSPYGQINRLYEIINVSVVPRKLEELGYEVVNLSLFDMAGQEQHYRLPFLDYLSLWDLLLQKSLYGYAAAWWHTRRLVDVHFDVMDRVRALAATPSDRPRFVYAHLLLPHWPYFFDRHGRRPNPVYRGGTKEDYLEQLIYVNQLMTNLVSDIRARSPKPPIIVLLGDHGYRALEGPAQREGASRVFYACHLPGGRREWLHDGMTPVNTFRVLFNRYFDARYPLVPDTFTPKNGGQTSWEH